MKRLSIMFTVLFSVMLSLGNACNAGGPPVRNKDTPAQRVAKVKASLKKWEKTKKDCKGNYSYERSTASMTGFRTNTMITVRGNKLFSRDYAVVTPQGKTTKPWSEKGAKIGSHKAGAAAKTLDTLYANALKAAGKKLANYHRFTLKFDKQGLLKYCFYVDTRIADDVTINGVIIENLQYGKK